MMDAGTTEAEGGNRQGQRNCIPVEIGATTQRHHITGDFALNIPSRQRIGGDWHKRSSWFAATHEELQEFDYTTEEEHGPLLDCLGNVGVHDARSGLRTLGHPQGDDEQPVWAAAYDRAVIEIAWSRVVFERKYRNAKNLPPIDTHELRRWLPSPGQWMRLKWLAWKVRRVLEGHDLEKWEKWRKEWRPWG